MKYVFVFKNGVRHEKFFDEVDARAFFESFKNSIWYVIYKNECVYEVEN